MQSKPSLKWSFFILGGAGILFFVFLRTFDLSNQASSSLAEQGALSAQMGFELPLRFKIPRLNIDAAVEYVGLTPDGAMDVPKGPANVAWFDLGPRPGEVGSAVLAGHSGYKNNKPAVFDSLYKIKKGDKVYVKDGKGNTNTFVVREIRIYGKNANAGDVFSSNDGKAHLNLVTCEGIWNPTEKTHSDRLVVFTDKEI